MINFFKFNYELRKLLRERRAISRRFELLYKVAVGDELNTLLHEEHMESVIVDDQIHRLVTNRLWEQAKKAMIPLPNNDEGMWEETETRAGSYHLSVEGISALRAALRKENKERWEVAVKWIVLLTGLVGAVTGLLAIILK
ncbi:MAG: hypothetical protein ACNY01_13935 [Desulfobacteria bacterium]